MTIKTPVALTIILGLVAALFWFFGYRTPALAPAITTVMPVAASKYTQASFSGNPIALELATTTTEQEKGLGGRPNVPDEYGMLFIFEKPSNYGFWMKGMEVPIDMFWLSDNGAVVTMKTEIATSTFPTVFYPQTPVQYVLETTSGYAKTHDIHPGSMLAGLTFLTPVLK